MALNGQYVGMEAVQFYDFTSSEIIMKLKVYMVLQYMQ